MTIWKYLSLSPLCFVLQTDTTTPDDLVMSFCNSWCFVLQIETTIREDLGLSVRNYTGSGNSTIDFLQVKVNLSLQDFFYG